MIPFENSLPIRRLTAFKGQRNFAGLWWCATNQRHVGFESWCEGDNLMLLDFDPNVAGFSSQPFRITLPPSLPQSSHVPDYFIRLADGSAAVIDVRPDNRVTPADQEIFQATADLCATVGWAYRRLGGLPPVLLANLRWLSGYRHRGAFARRRSPNCWTGSARTTRWQYVTWPWQPVILSQPLHRCSTFSGNT